MFLINSISPSIDANVFDCLSMANSHQIEYVDQKSDDVIYYMISNYPRVENLNQFSFVYQYTLPKEISFAQNQQYIIGIASEMFKNSVELSNDELSILEYTIKRTRRLTPTLPGRK